MRSHPDQRARSKQLEEEASLVNKDIMTKLPDGEIFDSRLPPYPVYTSTPTPMYEKFPKLLVKKLDPGAIIPTKANPTDAGYDLHALNGSILPRHTHKLIKTGISMAIPDGYVGLIWPRSGLAYKHGLDVLAGVIDSGYRGDIGVILYNTQYNSHTIEKGDRIAQILIQKIEDFDMIEVDNLDNTSRNENGFGSSGK